jgi:4-hydroxy-3-polyprenylbenzoate decarboxylase
MRYRSLHDFVTRLQSMGELCRIPTAVSPVLEITEIADRMVKHGGPALLFEHNGTRFPLLINAFASDTRMAAALGVKDLDQIPADLEGLLAGMMAMKDSGTVQKLRMLPQALQMARWLPRKQKGRGSCQEVMMEHPDLGELPVLTCWPNDGGPFITLPLVHTMDPITGQQNIGMYRMQVYDGQTTGMHWHLHKDGAAHFRKYRELGQRMPVTVTLGGDPAYSYAATAPLPPILDELMFAGVLRKRGVHLVKSLHSEIWIPEDSDIVIEGYVDPAEPLRVEGPFGDHTGFYSLADQYPVFHITTITHRKNAIYPTTIVGIPPQEDLWLGKATEKIFLMPVRKAVAPEVTGMHMPAVGVFHNLVLTSVAAHYPGQAQKVASALWGAGQMMFNKIVALLPEDLDVEDYPLVAKTLASNVDPALDIFFNTGPLDVLDHASRNFAFGSKMGLDATNQRALPTPVIASADVLESLRAIQGVVDIYADLIFDGIPLVFVFVHKSQANVREIHEAVTPVLTPNSIRFAIYLDHEALGLAVSDLLWLAAGNIDPQRDFFMGQGHKLAGFDATRKTLLHDAFRRDWPNLTTMNRETIQWVSQRWNEYQCGKLLSSPSEKYLGYQQGEGAVAHPGE